MYIADYYLKSLGIMLQKQRVELRYLILTTNLLCKIFILFNLMNDQEPNPYLHMHKGKTTFLLSGSL